MDKEIENLLKESKLKTDIIFSSTYEAINNFIEENNDTEKLIELCTYIGGEDSLNKPPTDFQKKFIKEFFTNDGWVELISQRKNPNSLFRRNIPFDFQTINSVLSFEVMRKVSLKISQLNVKIATDKVFKTSLKYDLSLAINNSYFDGVFDKRDGWCNVSDVLQKHKLITLE